MKKILFIILGIVLTFAACSKDDDKGENTNKPYGEITVDGKKYPLQLPVLEGYNEATYYSVEKHLDLGRVVDLLMLDDIDIDLDTLTQKHTIIISYQEINGTKWPNYSIWLEGLSDDENFGGDAISGKVSIVENNKSNHTLKFEFNNLVFEQTHNGVRQKTLSEGYLILPYERIDD